MLSICLCMIVKNEAHVITECLTSVAPFVDSYSIVDTGSSDATVEVIDTFFGERDIPGRVHRRPWVNFGHNRSEALELARSHGGYSLMMDADDLLHAIEPAGELTAAAYMLQMSSGSTRYWYPLLFRADRRWRYEGVVHEYPVCDDADAEQARLAAPWWVESRRLGARSQASDKYQRDAALLEAYLSEHPDDPRSVFYLAQSLRDAGDHAGALARYRQRSGLGGWDEEVFVSLWQSAMCLIALDAADAEIHLALLDAWEARPTRAEPLHRLALRLREQSRYPLAALYARQAAALTVPEHDVLFVDLDVYRWSATDELSIALYYTGDFAESAALCEALLNNPFVPEGHLERIRGNLAFAHRELHAS